MSKFFAYKLVRDYGFAPNPFNDICTLATCKPDIRKSARVGDWVFGIGSVALECLGHLIYAMKVTEKLSFNEYWTDERFTCKRPIMNGSLKTMYGDNIYHYSGNQLFQEDSHHSKKDGSINLKNVSKDTGADAVLISDHFYYFGNNHFTIPNEYASNFFLNPRNVVGWDEEPSKSFISWLESNYILGYHGDPIDFVKQFERAKG